MIQMFYGMGRGMVFYDGRNNVFATQVAYCRSDSRITALSAAAGKEYFRGMRI